MDAYYKSRYTFDKTRSVVWREIVRYLSPFIPAQGTAIDLGAGYCDFINNINARTKYAVDVSPEIGTHARPPAQVIRKPAWDLSPIADHSADVVHASNLLEHFTDEELDKTMQELKRVLKGNGRLILLQPNYRLSYKSYFDDPTHKKVFSDSALESFLIAHGFKIILKKPRFLPFSLRSRPSIIPVFPLLVRAYIHSPLKPFAGQMLFVSEKA